MFELTVPDLYYEFATMTKRFIWSKQNYFVNNNQNAISMIFEDVNKIYLPDAKNQQNNFLTRLQLDRVC